MNSGSDGRIRECRLSNEESRMAGRRCVYMYRVR